MSTLIHFKVASNHSMGCLTPEELVTICIQNSVMWINSLGSVWIVTHKESKEKVECQGVPDSSEFPHDEWDWIQTEEWSMDFN